MYREGDTYYKYLLRHLPVGARPQLTLARKQGGVAKRMLDERMTSDVASQCSRRAILYIALPFEMTPQGNDYWLGVMKMMHRRDKVPPYTPPR